MSKIPEITDINPASWLRPFQKNSVTYLIKMALFYHALSMGLLYVGSFLASTAITGYSPPQIPVSVLLAAAAGPFEDTVFFGIPFYLTSNPYVVLIFASVWSFAHVFSTPVIGLDTLAYGNFLFSIPHLFFALRTWTSGKGWFAIVFHSSWNVSILLSYCHLGLRSCVIVGSGNEFVADLLTVFAATIAVLFVYHIYKGRIQKTNNKISLFLLALLSAFIAMMALTNISLLF